jgi:hypothetical protein
MQIIFEGGPMNGRRAMVSDADEEYVFEMMPPPNSRDPNTRFLLTPRKAMRVYYRPSERDRRVWKPYKMDPGASR